MARNGSGAYSLPSGNPVTTGTVISSTWANTTLSDIATALTNSIAKDGQTTPTANLPMGGYKVTGLANGSATGDAIHYGQIGAIVAASGANADITSLSALNANLPMGGYKVTGLGDASATGDAIHYGQIGTIVAKSGANGDITSLSALGSINGGQIAGHRNKIIGYFDINQRALTTVADDAYCADCWYVLTESGNVGVAQVVNPESGAPFGWRIAQPDVSAKRIGLATIIESKNIRQYRSTAMHLAMRVKPSFAGNVRYAIIEHTGTADSVTSDVVNNWASTTYTPSNFFIAGVNILKTGTIAPGAGVFNWVDDWTTLGASCNNIILFFWSESAIAQNEEIAFNRPQFEPGTVRTPHEWRHNELELCQRYYRTMKFVGGRQYVVSNVPTWYFNFPTMFATPTITGTYIGNGSTPTIAGISADTGRITSATVGSTEALLYQDVLLVAPL